MRSLLAVLALTLASGEAPAAVCSFAAGISEIGPELSLTGVGTDCATPLPTDEFVVPAGAIVRQVGDITHIQRLTVEAGGEWVSDVLDRAGGPGAMELRPSDQIENTGGLLRLQGAFREMQVAIPSLASTPAAAGSLAAGSILPCPGWDDDDDGGRWEPDCGGVLTAPGDWPGSPNEVAIVWPPGDAGGNQFLQESVAAIAPGDIAHWEPGAMDEGWHYEITLADGDYQNRGVSVVLVDVRQTDPSSPKDTAYPLALREVRTGTLQVPIQAGASWENRATYVDTQVGVLYPDSVVRGMTTVMDVAVPRKHPHAGMCVAFEDVETGLPHDRVYRISRSWPALADAFAEGGAFPSCQGGDQSCDMFEIYDPRGLEHSVQAGDRFWIMPCQRRGDPFHVLVPLTLRDAELSLEYENEKLFRAAGGTSSWTGVLFEDGTLTADGPGTLLEMQHSWQRDPIGGCGNCNQMSVDASATLRLRSVSVSGGDSIAPGGTTASGLGEDRSHGIVGSTGAFLDFEGIYQRHAGDDYLVAKSPLGSIDIKRWRAQYASGDGHSQQMIDPAATPEVFLEDIECVQAVSNDFGYNTGIILKIEDSETQVKNMLSWSCTGVPHTEALGPSGAFDDDFFESFMSVGGQAMVPLYGRHFMVALSYTDQNDTGGGLTGLVPPSVVDIKNVLLRDMRRDTRLLRGPDEHGAGGRISNALFLNLGRDDDCTTAQCAVLDVRSLATTTSARIERVTIALRPGVSAEVDSAFRTSISHEDSYTTNGILAWGFENATGLGWGVRGSGAQTARLFQNTTVPPCFAMNTLDAQSPQDLPAGSVLGQDLGLQNPAAGLFLPLPGGLADQAGCGIGFAGGIPGIVTTSAMHDWMNVPPENAAGLGPPVFGVPALGAGAMLVGILALATSGAMCARRRLAP